MELNEEIEKKIINMGAMEYDEEKMSSILGIDIFFIKKEMKNEKSNFYKLYKKGKDLYDFAIDMKLFDLAKNGDLKAIDYIEKRKKTRKNE